MGVPILDNNRIKLLELKKSYLLYLMYVLESPKQYVAFFFSLNFKSSTIILTSILYNTIQWELTCEWVHKEYTKLFMLIRYLKGTNSIDASNQPWNYKNPFNFRPVMTLYVWNKRNS